MKLRCRCCGREQKRKSEEGWLLGFEWFDGQTAGIPPTDPQRRIVFLDEWDRSRTSEPGAVHFCSAECREEYLSMWYRDLLVQDELVMR
jgi:hypothetical protein